MENITKVASRAPHSKMNFARVLLPIEGPTTSDLACSAYALHVHGYEAEDMGCMGGEGVDEGIGRGEDGMGGGNVER